jgi:uncharacterized protein (DUF58 family)
VCAGGRDGRRDGPRPSFRFTARGAGIAVLAGAGWVLVALVPARGRVLAPLAASATAVLLAGTLATVRARARCQVVVTAHPVPAVVEVGGGATLRVTVTNHGRRRCSGTVVDLGTGGPWAPARSVVRTTALPPGGSETVDLPLSTARRGRLRGGPGRLWVLDPLAGTGTVVAPLPAWSLVVVPAARLPEDGWLTVGTSSRWRPAAASRPEGDDGTEELAGLRPYRLGDRLHRLHWPSLAPGRTPLVRTFGDATSPMQVPLVLDDRTGVHRRDGFDRVLALCLGVVDACHERGLVVDVRTLSGRPLPMPVGRGGRVELAVELAVLEPAQPVRDPSPSGAPAAPVAVTSPTGARSLTALLPATAVVVVAR